MIPLTPAQAALAAEHHEVAVWAARQAGWRWPAADRDDLLSWAYGGLLEAAQQYDPKHGMTFVGFARRVIRFAIIDAWRVDTGGHDANGRGGRRLRHEFTFDLMDPGVGRAASSVDIGFDAVENAVYAAACIDGLGLSPRTRAMLVELGNGRTLQDVATEFGVTESAVAHARAKVRRKLAQPQPAKSGVELRRCLCCSTVIFPPKLLYCSTLCKRRFSRGTTPATTRAYIRRQEKVSA